ncbi:uncharacterized protein [Periplaneta americana]|uniref:uncharacterized protein n=1 Tax=Periplaneta americana TaxID=6978 RepID=UPI0037E82AF7
MQQIYQRLIAPHEATLPQSVLEGLQRMCSTHKRAYFASLHGVSTMLANMNCSPVVVPHAYVPGSIAMSIAKHSPYRGLFKYNLQNMRRTGVLERLLQRAFPIHLPKNEMIVQSIDLTTICPILTLLGGGVLASLLILLIEISVVDRRMNRQRRNHRVLWW